MLITKLHKHFLNPHIISTKIASLRLGCSAQAAHRSLKKFEHRWTITGHPRIEVIFDGFGVVVGCIERFEVSNRPTILIALPMKS